MTSARDASNLNRKMSAKRLPTEATGDRKEQFSRLPVPEAARQFNSAPAEMASDEARQFLLSGIDQYYEQYEKWVEEEILAISQQGTQAVIESIDIASSFRKNILSAIFEEIYEYRIFTTRRDHAAVVKHLIFTYNKIDHLNSRIFSAIVSGITETEQVAALSLSKRLERLEEFAREKNGAGVAAYARAIFPELATHREPPEALPERLTDNLPSVAPELWQNRADRHETPPAFIVRVYASWQGKGLSKKLIRQLDPQLSRALYNWLGRGNEMPADLDLPTISELTTRTLEEMAAADAAGAEHPARHTLREAQRLRTALARRSRE